MDAAHQPEPPGRRSRVWLPAAVLLLGLAAAGLVVVVDQVRERALAHDQALSRSVDRMRLALLSSHLALEEHLAGDRQVEPPAIEADLAAAEALLAEIAAGAPDAPAVPDVPDVEAGAFRRQVSRIAGHLASLRELSARRLAAGARGETAAAGSPLEKEYDRRLESLLAELEELAHLMAVHEADHQRRATLWVALALAGWGGVVVAAAWALARHERRRSATEEALRRSEHRLQQAQKMEAVGRLAGGIAHDINNYLATIRAQCELVLSKELPRERLVDKMERVVAAVLKASSLIERLLAFGRRQPARPEVVSLNDVVEGFVRMVEGSATPDRTVETRLEPDLWPVEVDVAQIEQVLANLFVNARDATPAGGRITLTTSNGRFGAGQAPAPGGPHGEPGDAVCLAVTDTGRGIPRELREKIFDPFFTTKEAIGASGLGLATVYALVEGAGGSIEVESEVGRGSTFRVLLPRGRGRPAPRRPAPADEVPRGSERLLLVDDNRELAESIRSQLEALGYQVAVASGPEQALSAARRAPEPFDLVLTDVQLPTMAGPDLVSRLRSIAPLRALYMSGYTDRIALRSGPERGEAFFLKKPFSAAGLARMVRELLDAPAQGDARG